MSRFDREFEAWLHSLTRKQLLNSMEAELQDDEIELWHEMVRLQVPPLTPIHPKVAKEARRDFATDGRNANERSHFLRFHQPRLLQWIDRGNMKTRSKRKRKFPYQIIARKFCSADGTRYATPCTNEQKEADQVLLQSVYMMESPESKFLSFQNDKIRSKKELLHILHVASRGHFLSCGPPDASTTITQWLDPTNRWNSLSMHLVSRFEVAVWKSYQEQRRTSFTINWYWGKSNHCQQAIVAAVSDAFLETMLDDAKDPLHVRDALTWDLLDTTTFVSSPWFSCPLVELGSSMHRLKQKICQRLQLILAKQMENDLVNSLQNVALSQTNEKRKANQKKKTSRKHTLRMYNEHAETSESSSSHDETLQLPLHRSHVKSQNERLSPSRRNRNKIICLSIMEGIINDVFAQVGLSPIDDDFQLIDGAKKSSKETALVNSTQTNSDIPESSRESFTDFQTQRHEMQPVTIQLGYKEYRKHAIGASDPIANGDLGEDTPSLPAYPVPITSSSNPHNPLSIFQPHYGTLAGEFCHRPEPLDFAWGGNDFAFDEWGRVEGFGTRDRSIFEEFFHKTEDLDETQTEIRTTAASIASSTDLSHNEILDADETLAPEEIRPYDGDVNNEEEGEEPAVKVSESSGSHFVEDDNRKSQEVLDGVIPLLVTDNVLTGEEKNPNARAESPQAPATPSPTLSPILVSLADLREMRKETFGTPPKAPTLSSDYSVPSTTATSAPCLPPSSQKPKIVSTLSRENLQINLTQQHGTDKQIQPREKSPLSQKSYSIYREPAFHHPLYKKARDDADIKLKQVSKKSVDLVASYRSAFGMQLNSRDDNDIKHSKSGNYRRLYVPASHGMKPKRSTSKEITNHLLNGDKVRPLSSIHFEAAVPGKGRELSETCARSEIVVDGRDEWHDSQRSETNEQDDAENNTKDGSTTITSAVSQKEQEGLSSLKEERDTFRDLCLTLGAELAKLKNVLAAQKVLTNFPAVDYKFPHSIPDAVAFEPESMPPFFQNAPRAQTLAAMSDAGYRAEHESLASEDDFARGKVHNTRLVSSVATLGESDVSVEHSGQHLVHVPVGFAATREAQDSLSNGIQSRLSRDINQFIDTVNSQLRKQENRRGKAIERITRLVNAVWPRAQVIMYGSHATGLCLPSSDLDFVIRLPAVHKNAPAVAPGALEGRNAINETSQKLLARKLKGESWIDPRSMKLIERTVVPVIKVATKDTRARTLQLDITFDSPGHHGLEAIGMVNECLDEFPLARPLVLVLKQFLTDRGLLTAYTGGLSSYCLFLLVIRYLQEQQSSWGDCGMLLMGFLDFYGNHYDPRSTGISVRRRVYFSRPNYAAYRLQAIQPLWNHNPSHVIQSAHPRTTPFNFVRRNSLSDKGSVDPNAARQNFWPPRYGPVQLNEQYQTRGFGHQTDQPVFDVSASYNLDPLLVEDPLSEGNNVGRNAFRIFQIQRAFSDAHRALVASLEWSTSELHETTDLPLLNCILQSEDVVFEL